MNATEEEFMKLYTLQRNFEAQTGSTPATGTAEWNQFHQQARDALGESRYSEWVRAQDPDYREIVRVTSRFKLPGSVAAELHSYKQPIEEERAKLDANPNLTPPQKEAAYVAMAQEIQQVYKQALGEKAFRYYSRRTTNPWVRAGEAKQ